jgi:dTDP-4-dehydrorhamnose reductase
MRTLIFGGTGMLGRALVKEARGRGWPALGLAHGQADLCDAAGLVRWAETFRPEVVVNAAAFTRVDDCERARARAMAVNGAGAGHAAAAAAAVGARLLHVSSDYVFDGIFDNNAREPYREDAPTAPLSAYGESKLEGERRALGYARALVVRASWLFGPGGANFVLTILRLIAKGGPLRVVDDQLGCPTYTRSLARALLDLAPLSATGIVHYRDREPVTWYAFACAIARLWPGPPGKIDVSVEPIATRDFPRPARRPAYSVLDVTRFESLAGRRVEPWEVGLAEYLTSIRRQGGPA